MIESHNLFTHFYEQTVKVVPDTDLGYRKMKKNIFVAFAVIAVSATTIMGLSSFTSKNRMDTDVVLADYAHESCRGKHCTYTVGCSCSGFAPKTNGKEWEKSYCKRCGHHKKYHK